MGSVDFYDQMIKPDLATRRSIHWYKSVSIYSILFYLIVIGHLQIFHHLQATGRHGCFLNYQQEVITTLVYHQGPASKSLYSDVIPPLETYQSWN